MTRRRYSEIFPTCLPAGQSESSLNFKNVCVDEQIFLRRKLSLLTRPGDTAPSLLARLTEAQASYEEPFTASHLNWIPMPMSPIEELSALHVMRPAWLRSVAPFYGALIEYLRTRTGAD